MAQKTQLTVTQAFGDYAVGDIIALPDAVEAIAASHPAYVVRTVADVPAAKVLNEATGEFEPAPKPTSVKS